MVIQSFTTEKNNFRTLLYVIMNIRVENTISFAILNIIVICRFGKDDILTIIKVIFNNKVGK